MKKSENISRFFDPSVLIGLIGAFLFIGIAIFLNGSLSSFLNGPSALIVLGGTLFACIASFSLTEIVQSFIVIFKTLFRREQRLENVAAWIMRGSEIAHSSGVLSLQKSYAGDIRRIPFLSQGVSYLIDGMSGKECQAVMSRRMQSNLEAKMNAVAVLNKAGEIAPAMGLIGTLIGLVQMLSTLSDPTTIGPSMSIAIITTFYGALLAYVVFLPLATKLEREAEQERQLSQLCLVGLAAIDAAENPRRTEIELNSVLPADKQLHLFEE